MWKERYHLLGNLMLHRHALSGMTARGHLLGRVLLMEPREVKP